MLSGLLNKQMLLKNTNYLRGKTSTGLSRLGAQFQPLSKISSAAFASTPGVKIPYNSSLQGMIQWYQENGH